MEIKRFTPMKIVEIDYKERFSMDLEKAPESVVLVLDRKSLIRERGFFMHHKNVFMLSSMHDWDYKRGKLKMHLPVDPGTRQVVGLAYGHKTEKAEEFGLIGDMLCAWPTIRTSSLDYSGMRIASDLMFTSNKMGLKSITHNFQEVVKHLLVWKCNADPKSADTKIKLNTKAKQVESLKLAGRDGIVVLQNALNCLYLKLNGRRFDIVDIQVNFDFDAKSYGLNLKYSIGE